MMVSVVVPVYNVAQYVWDCLWSVGQQDYTDIECLIIEDHSTDKSMGVVRKFVEQYHGNVEFRIISLPVNRGLSEARNIGIENSKGDFIFFSEAGIVPITSLIAFSRTFDLMSPTATTDISSGRYHFL